MYSTFLKGKYKDEGNMKGSLKNHNTNYLVFVLVIFTILLFFL